MPDPLADLLIHHYRALLHDLEGMHEKTEPEEPHEPPAPPAAPMLSLDMLTHAILKAIQMSKGRGRTFGSNG